jgi:hypothetical protein
MAEREPSVLVRHWRIADARGRKVSQVDPVALYLMRQHDVIKPDVLRAIAHEKGVRISPGERLSLIGGVLCVLLVIGLIIQSLISGDFDDAPLARSSSLLMFCLFAWIYWLRAKWARFGNIAAAMLKHGRCPHCGYNLRHLPVEAADGATVCPECGCAWKLGEEQR